IGAHASDLWTMITSDEEKLRETMQSYAAPTSQSLLKFGATIGRGLIDITLGVIFAYFFFRHGTRVAIRIHNLIHKFFGEKGQHLLQISKNTLIGVVYGILGTAVVQGGLAAVGFLIVGLPGATFLGLVTFFLSFIPSGPPIIWLPAALWLISEG